MRMNTHVIVGKELSKRCAMLPTIPDLGYLVDKDTTVLPKEKISLTASSPYIVPYSKWIPVKCFETCKDHEPIFVAKVVTATKL